MKVINMCISIVTTQMAGGGALFAETGDHAQVRQSSGDGTFARYLDSNKIQDSFQISDFGTPLKYQTDFYCWDHASRGVVEWLMNRSNCENKAWGGVRSMNQDRSIMNPAAIDDEYQRFVSRASSPAGDLEKLYRPMSYAQQVQKFLPEGSEMEQDLLYATYKGKSYHPESKLNANIDEETAFGGGLTPVSSSALYHSSPAMGPKNTRHGLWDVGGISDREVNAIKEWMTTHQSPVLFTFVPMDRDAQGRPLQRKLRDGKPFWHAAYIMGWNEKGFIVRDSSYGKKVYDTANQRWNRDTTLMPYQHFKDSGKAAAGYRMKGNVPDCGKMPPANLQDVASKANVGQNVQTRPSSLGALNEGNHESQVETIPFQHVHDESALSLIETEGEKPALPTVRAPSIVPSVRSASAGKPYWYRGQIWHYYPLASGRSREKTVHGKKVPTDAIGYYLGPNKQLSFAKAVSKQAVSPRVTPRK